LVKARYGELKRHLVARKRGETIEEDAAGEAPAAAAEDVAAAGSQGPTGPGWVIELKGYHYYNNRSLSRNERGANHVRFTFLQTLEEGTITLPDNEGNPVEFTMQELGIQFPLLLSDEGEPLTISVPNPDASHAQAGPGNMQSMMMGGEGLEGMEGDEGDEGTGFGPAQMVPGAIPGATPGAAANGKPPIPASFEVRRYSFTIQFCWQEKRLSDRLIVVAERKAKEAKEAEEAAKAAEAAQAESAAAAPAAGGDTGPADAAAVPEGAVEAGN
jgi:type IV pilus assembly protein PilM